MFLIPTKSGFQDILLIENCGEQNKIRFDNPEKSRFFFLSLRNKISL